MGVAVSERTEAIIKLPHPKQVQFGISELPSLEVLKKRAEVAPGAIV